MPLRSILRAAAPLLLLGATAFALHQWNLPERPLPRRELADFPRRFADWDSTEVRITDDVRETLGNGDFMQRIYQRAGQSPVDLFIAYFGSQRAGSTLHSPKNCLPGSGWTPLESSREQLRLSDGRTLNVNRYVIARGSERQLVLYWYQAHGRTIASEYDAKFYLVADAMRMNRTDGSLVRMVTPLGNGESFASAQQRLTTFAEQAVPQLDPYIPN